MNIFGVTFTNATCHLGLLYMARAGYDPRQSIAFWQRFSTYQGQGDAPALEFLSTHPLDETRIRALQDQMPNALAEYEKSSTRRSPDRGDTASPMQAPPRIRALSPGLLLGLSP